MEEIPTLYPTEQEFENPIDYLSNPHIKRLGIRYGMIKVIPPGDFRPPLSIDVENFTFQPRIQNLENLDLVNRCRLFFMKQLNNFSRSTGHTPKSILKAPYTVVKYEDPAYQSEKRSAKVYFYDVFVELIKDKQTPTDTSQSSGRKLKFRDISQIKEDRTLWRTISKKFNVPASSLKQIFEKYIASYYIFLHSLNEKVHTALHNDQYPKSLLSDDEDDEDDFDLGPDSDSGSDSDEDDEACVVCQNSEDPKRTILCDSCDKPFHIYCLTPSLERVPPGDWICNTCIVGNGYYGFTQDTHDYSLREFQRYCKHQNSKLLLERELSIDDLEKIFWNLVTNDHRNALTTVKYGADIHNELPGQITGFPTREFIPKDLNENELKSYFKYCDHPMNLTNLPMVRNSLLPLFERNISGMTIPWIYVGSVFSTFCWHMEDQYTLSANYQHEGDPKIWYSIPESGCAKFNDLLNDLSPDLFVKQPDLLHQLVTLISPYDPHFKKFGIPVYKAIQNANEYIITFPKCYHAGFNTGYNFNEAVNFTIDFWLPYGFGAIADYKSTQKPCVFDMFDLMINVLDKYNQNTLSFNDAFARQCYSSLIVFYNTELRRIRRIQAIVSRTNLLTVDSDPDDEDEEYDVFCSQCKTICSMAFVLHERNEPKLARTKKRHKRNNLSVKQWNEVSTTYGNLSVLCPQDFLKKLQNSNSRVEEEWCVNDELYLTKSLEDIDSLIRQVGVKLDK
ncbi:YJR119C [Saccharomyces arboricola H-6]|uniref:YJR119C n=1 Tax=Saccharomyces arboricola (strain H-6 / AS 2.3317 / CBS 10644) TaxID=1160507 RepID=J8Q0F7_SACAR|nr:YJR119C [Saccharomyces arboricola H-6]